MVVGQGARYYAEQSWLGVFSVSQIQVNALHPQEFGPLPIEREREREREREKLPCIKPAELPAEKEAQFR
jgi:hypothetical protein